MEKTSKPAGGIKPKPWYRKIYDFLSGFHLATTSLILLMILTWLATLEQVDNGLYPTLNKYFSWKALYLIPEIKGKMVPIILPGGYYVSALLLVNMILGGIIRIRKGWRQFGNLVSHFGIVFMLLAGGVAHHFSERGNMAVGEGESSDTAEDYFEYVVEVAEVKEGRQGEIHVIRGKFLKDLTGGKSRSFEFKGLPFSLEISGYLRNAQTVSSNENAPANHELTTDGYYLFEKQDEKEAEMDLAGCYAIAVFEGGEKSAPFILAGASFHPFTVRVDDRLFTVDMRKRLWPMGFAVK
ncbi:MAG: cytochrome c biogenesis protein ResB, partial [Armatimonadetes bacterium]|nr:cytochrome c biogenesis protein ResB [Akkermansiaceae bacterium]